MTAAAPAPTNVVPLPNPRRTVTRARICEAAGELFFDIGFAAVTMEQIAQAANIRRSTLYLHFREKDEVLTAIAEDYTVKLREIIAGLPGPVPSLSEIAAWVDRFAAFVSQERAATELLVSLSHLPKAPAAAVAFGQALRAMMAQQVAAFEQALQPGQTMTEARAISVMDTLGWALCHHARTGGCELSRARLNVAVEDLDRFVRRGEMT
jgi:AcrR family transcriptional regulator